MSKLPLTTQTLYAELIDQLLTLEAHRSIGSLSGAFLSKTVKGESYYYFQHSIPGGKTRQIYIGRKCDALDRVIEQYRKERPAFDADEAVIQRLCAQLRAGGALVTDTPSARVIASLAASGVFRHGGMLVGTHAFTVLGNLLGVKWEGAALRTHDVDIAGERALAVAIPDSGADIPAALDSLKEGFIPVPPLNPKHPSTSFSIRGNPLRVDILTTARKPADVSPVFITRFNVAAQPLFFLDFLLEKPVHGAVINGGGVLVNVPDPARFALHKLIVAQERSVTEHQKREKDLRQAAQILNLLVEERPGDLALAIDDIRLRGKGWLKRVRSGISVLAGIAPALDRRVVDLFSEKEQ